MTGRWTYPPVPEGHKYCPACKTPKLATPKFFTRKSDSPDGLHRRCKDCIHAYRKQPEIHAKEIEGGRRHYAAHREREIANALKWEREHKEHVRDRKKRQKAKPQEREKARQRTRAWYAAHREYALKQNKVRRIEYVKAHPDHARHNKSKRRARMANAPGTHTPQQLRALYRRQRGCCYYCKAKFATGKNTYHADHIVPISRGGSNDISNIVLACPPCNLSKGNKLLHEWIQGGRLL